MQVTKRARNGSAPMDTDGFNQKASHDSFVVSWIIREAFSSSHLGS
jgi:hypothetical protein